jgi:hypothetical protein
MKLARTAWAMGDLSSPAAAAPADQPDNGAADQARREIEQYEDEERAEKQFGSGVCRLGCLVRPTAERRSEG